MPTFADVRDGLAKVLGGITGLTATGNRLAQVNPPCAVIIPAGGTVVTYSQTTDGEYEFFLRAILLVAEANSASGQDNMDPFLAASGSQSIWGAVQANQTLSGLVSYAEVTEAAGYGLINWNGVDYLGCHFLITVGA